MKNTKKLKLLFFTLAFSLLNVSLFAAGFSPEESTFIEEIFDFRLSLRSYNDADTCIKKIAEFKNLNKDKIASLSDEARLTAQNMLATAEYNCEYEKDMHSSKMEGILRPCYEENTRYAENKEVKDLNPYFVLTSADIANSMMQFLPRSSSITIGLKEKKDYAAIIENNPNLSFALTLSGWWYYYAPAVGGGSTSKAQDFFKSAQESARSNYDRYYCNINLAQFYFEKKDYELCEKYMKQAEDVLKNTRYIAFLRKINTAGYSLFDYNMNSRREKIDGKIADQVQLSM